MTRTESDAALAPAVPDPGLRQFLLQNFVSDGARLRWRIDLEAIADALPDLTGFPAMVPGTVYEGPTLFLRGAQSSYVTSRDETPIRMLFPTASIVAIDAAGHWLHAEQPAAVTAEITRFLDVAAPGRRTSSP